MEVSEILEDKLCDKIASGKDEDNPKYFSHEEAWK